MFLRYKVLALIGLLLLTSCVATIPPGIQIETPGEETERYEQMPVLSIMTERKQPVTSREEYVPATFSMTDSHTPAGHMQGAIHGRGNASWWNAEKKSYRIKLEEKAPLLGRPESRHWVLIANYFDKTMLRNELAFYMSRTCQGLPYTPQSDFVEVYFNGNYEGVYVLADHLRLGLGRVQDEVLLQIDVRAEERGHDFFRIPHCSTSIVIEDPDCTPEDPLWEQVTGFVTDADTRLFDGDLSKLDLDSFADWYLINEIARNNDAVFFASCFMSLNLDGKLRMGPVWDFDIGFGNVNYNGNDETEGFWVSTTPWIARLLEEEAFRKKVKEHFDAFYARRQEYADYIDRYADYLAPYIARNEDRWHTMRVQLWANPVVFHDYPSYIRDLKTWLEDRLEWMKKQYDSDPSMQ